MKNWTLGLAGLLLMLALPLAMAEEYIEGAHYERIEPPMQTRSPDGQVEVLELFWYGCPHCFSLEPHLEAWLKDKPDNVSFLRVPAVLNPNWTTHAQAYYAAEAIGEVETIHGPMFQAIHVQRRRLSTPDQILRFVGSLGVDTEAFAQAFNDPAIRGRLQESFEIGRASQSSGVPTLVVAGKYRITASLAGGYPEMLDVADYLIRQEAGQR
ncbi:MAG: thiol:disulfide interchange protein DsbA/DsbL [Gammaproteobacteria bacterium]|nr:thiol:disulfide interchange protein DsbA/DsbL [Gammaproteobacteria bacterium]MDX5375756.1 thiol:disulfide interchange protein DsbA/DsbL [Gammaproteobacteria bacterium]